MCAGHDSGEVVLMALLAAVDALETVVREVDADLLLLKKKKKKKKRTAKSALPSIPQRSGAGMAPSGRPWLVSAARKIKVAWGIGLLLWQSGINDRA